MWLTEEQQRIWRSYLTMVGRLETAMNRQLQRDCELSLSDYDVLVALSEGGPQRISELAAVLAWEQSRLSHQLRRMRGRGLVERHGSDNDRRSATVELTANGRTALQTAAPGHAELVRTTVFDGLSDAQLKTFETVLERITSQIP